MITVLILYFFNDFVQKDRAPRCTAAKGMKICGYPTTYEKVRLINHDLCALPVAKEQYMYHHICITSYILYNFKHLISLIIYLSGSD